MWERYVRDLLHILGIVPNEELQFLNRQELIQRELSVTIGTFIISLLLIFVISIPFVV